MNPGGFFTTFETSASSVWDAWKKIETSVDASLGIQTVTHAPAPTTPLDEPVTVPPVEQISSEAKEDMTQTEPATTEVARQNVYSDVAVKDEKLKEPVNDQHESQLLRLAARNAQLESELQALQTASGSANAAGEFSARLVQVETKLRAMTSERDGLKKELDLSRKNFESKTESAREAMGTIQREAENAKRAEQEVRSEGEKLAKQIAKLEMLLKNVRSQLGEKTASLEAETARAVDAESKLQESQKEMNSVKEELKKWEGSTESLKVWVCVLLLFVVKKSDCSFCRLLVLELLGSLLI
jgi:chromosome segregation ATPase